MTDWYYATDGDSRGPVSESEILALIDAGKITPDTLVWQPGMDQWRPARDRLPFGTQPPPLGAAAPPRSFTDAIRVCFTKYATFRGRASRSEYWYFVLFTWLASFAIELILGQATRFGSAFSLVVLIPMLAAGVRRLHDIDRSGWWICGGFFAMAAAFAAWVVLAQQGVPVTVWPPLMGLIWMAYWIVLLIFLCKPGTPGPNRFG